MKAKDTLYNALTYISAGIGVFVLGSILVFMFSKGLSGISWEMIKGNYWSENFLANVEEKKVFEKSGVTVWECRNCGHIVIGTKAPDVCPVCKHPQSYFEVHEENY